MTISLFFFSSGESAGGGKYDGIVEAARFADEHGFEAVWVPERHFMEIGCLYPSPAILIAALARETRRVSLRAGSVVLPLHNAIRVAEEWSMLDNLSDGRVGMACASGWQPDDFVLAPGRYETRREDVDGGIERIRRLWSGEKLELPRGDGKLAPVKLYPTPRTRALPIWMTSAGNPETFAAAGRMGTNVLTYGALFDIDGLAERVRLYRETLQAHGFPPAAHKVTVWVQACLGNDEQNVRREAFAALRWYFRSDARKLFSGLVAHHTKRDVGTIAEADFDSYVELLCHRLIENGMVLIGTPRDAQSAIDRLKAAGVDEVACQIDYGLGAERQRGTLEQLAALTGSTRTVSFASPHISPIAAALRRCNEEIAVDDFYAALHAAGFEYGQAFRRLTRIHRRDGESVVRVAASTNGRPPSPTDAVLLDASLHAIFAALPRTDGNRRNEFRVASIDAFEGDAALPMEFQSHVTIHVASESSIVADVTLYDDAGARVAAFHRVTIAAAAEAAKATGLAYEVRWHARARGSRAWNGVAVGIDGDEGGVLSRALEELGAVVMLPSPTAEIESAHLVERCTRAIALINQCVSTNQRLWIVTRGAMAAADGDPVTPMDAPLWGIARTAMREHPEIACSIVDLPESPRQEDWIALDELIASGADEPQSIIRGGTVHEPRLTPIPSERHAPFTVAGDATVLITGATAALTLPVARFLADRGCRRLVLASRRIPDVDLLGEIESLGMEIALETLDVSRLEEVQRVVSRHAIRGVVHLAAAPGNALLMRSDAAVIENALGAKAIGAWNLHQATAAMPLDFFLLFSSAAAFLGSAGQAPYAAANAFLDALAEMRRARGLAATSIQWGPWAERGMAARASAVMQTRWSAEGVLSLDDDDALAALGNALESPRATTLVLGADWKALTAALPRRHAAMFAALSAPAEDRATDWRASLDGASAADRRRLLDDYLAREVATALALTDTIDRELPLQDLGLDSLMALVLKNGIAADLEVDVPVKLLLEGVSLAALLDLVDAAVASRTPSSAPASMPSMLTRADAERMLAGVDQLSDAQVESLLATMLMEETNQAHAGRSEQHE